MDMTESIVPKSDQLNADDLVSGPITVTVSEVVKGNAEQPVDVRLVEYPGRAYRPSKSMRRVMVMAWGKEASAYSGRRLTLFRNPDITFGKDKVGGIEISHLSHLEKPLTVALTATRGKRKSFTVKPLTEQTTTNNHRETAEQYAGRVERVTNDPRRIENRKRLTSARDYTTEAKSASTLDQLHTLYREAKAAGESADTLQGIQTEAARFDQEEEAPA